MSAAREIYLAEMGIDVWRSRQPPLRERPESLTSGWQAEGRLPDGRRYLFQAQSLAPTEAEALLLGEILKALECSSSTPPQFYTVLSSPSSVDVFIVCGNAVLGNHSISCPIKLAMSLQDLLRDPLQKAVFWVELTQVLSGNAP